MPETFSALSWDDSGSRFYETGVQKTVLYVQSATGTYPKGVAWNGVTAINENPSGAEASDLYADDILYVSLTSAEKWAGTIEAYQSPEEFDECDGAAELTSGVTIRQQPRKSFGLCYRTTVGNDVLGDAYGYKLHLVYGCKAAPSSQDHGTVNESPEAATLSWELSSVPVSVDGFKPTATLELDSTKLGATKMAAIEKVLYGSANAQARLPLPSEIKSIIEGATTSGT